jgi:hypothetical protein
LLFGQVHRPEATLADELQELVWTDPGAGTFGVGEGGAVLCPIGLSGFVEEASEILVRFEERFNLCAEAIVAATGFYDEG